MVEVPVFTFFFEIWRVIEWNQMALHYYSMQFFFLFICQEPITWPANNCQQKIICSCAMSLNCVWLKIIFCSCGNEIKPRFSPFCDRSCVKMKVSRRYSWKSKLGDRMIKQLLKLGYRKISWFASVPFINYLPHPSVSANNWPAHHWQITIFCSTRPIIVSSQ